MVVRIRCPAYSNYHFVQIVSFLSLSLNFFFKFVLQCIGDNGRTLKPVPPPPPLPQIISALAVGCPGDTASPCKESITANAIVATAFLICGTNGARGLDGKARFQSNYGKQFF